MTIQRSSQAAPDPSFDPAVSEPPGPEVMHFGQPRGFWSLAFTEIWERFSYFGLQVTLTFYLVYSLAEGGLNLAPATAVSIVGAYGGSVYLSQLIGAWLADRLLSARVGVLAGAAVIMLGHISLGVIPGIAGLAIGLSCIALGTGALKTNIATIVGTLYDGRARTDRDAGFSYFVLALNIGVIAGPLLTGFLQSRYGFHIAFLAAAIGMFFALVQFCFAFRTLPPAARMVRNPIDPRRLPVVAVGVVVAIAALAALFLFRIVTEENMTYAVGVLIVVVVVGYFAMMLRTSATSTAEKTRMVGYLPMWVAQALFYGLLLQVFTTIPLFVTERVDLNVGGWRIPEGWFSIVGSVALAIVLILMATVWKNSALGRLSASRKYALALAIVGVSYLLLLLTEGSPGRTVPPLLIVACLVVAGVSEVLVAPVSLSLITSIAPERFQSQAVALSILSLGAGASLAGVLGILYTKISTAAFFGINGMLGLVGALVLLYFARPINTAMAQ